MFLSLDTSDGAAVAVLNGSTTLASARQDNPRQHTESLAPMVQQVLADAQITMTDLDGIVVGTGPAPFTGLRVGLITARTLGQVLGTAVYGVSALAGLARQAFDTEDLAEVAIVTDARRKEVYWARYAPAGDHDVVELASPSVVKPDELALQLASVATRGRGVELYPEHFTGASLDIDPAALGRIAIARLEAARLAGTQADLPTEPLYLRRPDIHQASSKKRAT